MNNQLSPPLHRILVVDDNPAIHEDFRKILCPAQSAKRASVASMAEELFGDAPPEKPVAHFDMESAYQGQEALAKVQAAEKQGRPFSLAFVDVRMPPGWDGIETIERIWKDYPHIQIVICTAYSDYSWEQILGKLGESDSLVILKKPFDNVEVLQLAHALTKKWLVTQQASARMADLDERVRRRTEDLLEANNNLHSEIQRRSLIEGALRESEERFHKAFETVAVALALRPLEGGGFLDVNQSFVSLSGYSKEELLTRETTKLNLFVAPDQFAGWIQALRSGKKITNAALEVRRKNGEIRQTMASVELLKLGEQSCLLTAFLDITEQKHLEAQLRQAHKMEAVGQLAAGIAHDFNNLLTVIHGYASLQLGKSKLDEDVAKAFTRVKLASERASDLTRQLLAFSRKQVVRCRPISLASILSRVQDTLQQMLPGTIHFECTCAPALPLVRADESNLEQVIINLAANGRDAMPDGGTLTLKAEALTLTKALLASHPERREGDFVLLTVSDTGCGMDQQTLARIFEPFFTTKPMGRGSGLGLSTVYGIVKQHEGWLEVESEPGQGTTFRVFLPATREEPEPAASPEASPNHSNEPPPLSRRDAILVVEDQPEVRDFMTSVLKSNGYQVVQSECGADALLQWNNYPLKIRLLITDMIMPGGINGSMLAQQLLRRDPELKIVYTSGYSPEAGANSSALEEGLNFISKPFTQESLLHTVRNALSNRGPALDLAASADPASPSI